MAKANKDKSWLNLKFHDNKKQKIVKPDEIEITEKSYPPSINDINILNRIKGSLFGLAIGDALGAYAEFRSHNDLEANPVTDLQRGGTWKLERGQFTDDTSMALCLSNSLIVCEDFVGYDQLERYKWWYRYGYMSSIGYCFDIGRATEQSIQKFEERQRKFAENRDLSIDEMDYFSNPDLFDQFDIYCSKDGVAGNGALMRLAPVPLFFYRDPIKAIHYSGISGQMTHGDKKASDACRYYGALIVAALNGELKNDLLDENFYTKHKSWFGDGELHPDVLIIAQGSFKKKGGYDEGIRGKGYIINALEAALWAFWNDQDSFEKGVLDAVNLGEDTDTTAAIYGQLAGAYYSYEKLPSKWANIIYAKDFLLCISHWIEYQGNLWVKKNNSQLLTNSNRSETTKTDDCILIDHNKPSLINSNNNNHRLSSNSSLKAYSTNRIERKLVDSSARVGSLYNIFEDFITQLTDINLKLNVTETNSADQCLIESGHKIQCQDLLKFVGFDDQYRLSLISNIVKSEGIASLIQYPYLIDEFTRILYYNLNTKQIDLLENNPNISNIIHLLTSKHYPSTHIITKIIYGIDLLIILKFNSSHSNGIDQTTKKIQDCLINNISTNDIDLNPIVSTFIYSNLNELNNKTIDLIKLCQYIIKIKKDFQIHQPINYILQSLDTFTNLKNYHFKFNPIRSAFGEKIEEYSFEFLWINKIWSTYFKNHDENLLNKYFEEEFNLVKQKRDQLNSLYETQINQMKILIKDIRYGRVSQKILDEQFFNEKNKNQLKSSVDDFIHSFTNLKEKLSFINDLNQQSISYENANKYPFITNNDNQHTLQQKLIEKNSNKRIICSNDQLNYIHLNKLNKIIQKLTNKKKIDQSLALIYLDFSSSICHLDDILLLPTDFSNDDQHQQISLTDFNPNIKKESPSIDKNNLNILFLGKAGAGKSTLINNFKNCFKFNRYDQFLSSGSIFSQKSSVVQIFHLGQRFLRFGFHAPNENFDHPDESITDKCQLYNFKLNDNCNLSLIDTPGFSQENSDENDEILMQHILSSINNLTHLNAICIVIQSDEIQFDNYCLYLTKLFHFLGEKSISNLIFCFTKTLSNQSIEYDQRIDSIKSLIKKMNIKNIDIGQDNILNFDSTYLVYSNNSNQNRSSSNRDNISEQSWIISKNGWNHFIRYIRSKLQPLILKQGLENVQALIFQINLLIRPLLEFLRNYFRKLILKRRNYPNCSIQLIPQPLSYPSAICYNCKTSPSRYGPFYIFDDELHEYRNTCHDCQCLNDKHMKIQYKLLYKYLENNSQVHNEIVCLKDLLYIITNLSYFILQNANEKENDLFLLYLTHMIDQEFVIAERFSNTINMDLYNELLKFQTCYQQQMNRFKQKNLRNDLNIENLVDIIKSNPIIKQQFDAATNLEHVQI